MNRVLVIWYEYAKYMNLCNQKSIYLTKRELDRLNFSSALKTGELTQKNQGHVADRPVALFSDDQLGFPGHLLFSFLIRLIILSADQQGRRHPHLVQSNLT